MQYQLLALDIDGTILNSQKKISERTKQAIRQAQEAGVEIVLASGRPTAGVWPVVRELGLDQTGGYFLPFNGARIIHCQTGAVLKEQFLPGQMIDRVIQKAGEYRVSLMAYRTEDVITEQPDDPYIQLEARINGLAVTPVADMRKALDFPANKFLMLADGSYLAEVEKRAAADLPELNIYRSEPYFLEIMPDGVDKASGLRWLGKHLGIPAGAMLCCGDGYNDLSMIRSAGLGVAMGNAQESVKQAADVITAPNDEDGAAKAIARYLLCNQSNFISGGCTT